MSFHVPSWVAAAPLCLIAAAQAQVPAPAPRAATPAAPAASAALIEAPAAGASHVVIGGRPRSIEQGPRRSMTVGEVATIELSNVGRIAIGNGALVKATVVDDRQIVLLAEQPGETTMHVWLKNGRQITYQLHVGAQRYDRLLADLTDMLKGVPTVKARMLDDRVVLEGRYPDSESATKIKRLTATFPQVLNLIPDRPADADPLQLERMVQLDLKVVEAKKRAVDQLGIRWATTAAGPTVATNLLGYANTPWRPDGNAAFPPVNTLHPAASYLGLATQITSALQFLEERGDAWTLAEPRLSCKSGGESKFIAGGEIPIPVPQGNGAIGVIYKQYGVVINFKPLADGAGNVQSGILIEVSQPDPRNSNQGFIAFTTNRAETDVAIKEGEPLVIAGLLRQTVDKSSDALPGLGRLPLLGALFGEKEARTEQTELFVVVTPHVITPASASNQQGLQRGEQLKAETRERTEGHLKPGAGPNWTPRPPMDDAQPQPH